MPDVVLTTGADNSGIKAGMAELRNEVSKAQRDITSTLGQAITFGGVTGIIAGLQQVINEGEEIHHLSERFAIDAEQLQKLSNAAKEDGVSMESVARSTNKMIISQQGAIDGSEKQVKAFKSLGISVDELKGMGPDQLMMRLADGMHNAGDRTEAYAAIAVILGARMGTDLIPMLEKGSKAIEEQSARWKTLSNAEVAELHTLKVEEDRYLQSLSVFWGKIVAGWGYIFELIPIKSRQMWASIINPHGDDAKKAADDLEKFYLKAADASAPRGNDKRPRKDPDNNTNASSSSDSGGTPGATSDRSVSAHESAQARIDKLNEEHSAKLQTSEQNLTQLQSRRNDLLKEAEAITSRELSDTIDQGARDKNNMELAQNQLAIDKVSETIGKEKTKAAEAYTKEREKAEEQAQKEIDAATEHNQLLRDTAQFGSEIAAQLAEQRKLDSEIADVTDQINQAWSEGAQTLAEQKTESRALLETEKALTAEAQARAAAEKEVAQQKAAAARDAADRQAKGQTFINNLQGQLDSVLNSDAYKKLASQQGAGAAMAAFFPTGNWALTMGTDIGTGQVDYNQVRYYQALYDEKTNGGKNNLGWQDQLAGDKRAQQIAATAAERAKAQDALDAAESEKQRRNFNDLVIRSQGQYWGQPLTAAEIKKMGLTGFVQPGSSSGLPPSDGGQVPGLPIGGSGSSGLGGLTNVSDQLLASISAQILAQLKATHTIFVGPPGSK